LKDFYSRISSVNNIPIDNQIKFSFNEEDNNDLL